MTQPFHNSPRMDGLAGYQIRMLNLRFDEAARQALSEFAISPAKVAALGLVAANPGCGQSALARALSINRASAMKLVNVLEEHSLVERRPGADLRSNALHLTNKGRELLPLMLARLAETDREVLAGLSPDEQAQLSHLLARASSRPA